MKYENQDKQYLKGAWSEPSEAQITRQSKRWAQRQLDKPIIDPVSPYADEQERQFARATRKDQRLARQMQEGLNKLEIRDAEARYKNS